MILFLADDLDLRIFWIRFSGLDGIPQSPSCDVREEVQVTQKVINVF